MRPAESDAAKPGPRGCARAPGGAGPRWRPNGLERRRGEAGRGFPRVLGRLISQMFFQNLGFGLSCWSVSHRKSYGLGVIPVQML